MLGASRFLIGLLTCFALETGRFASSAAGFHG
jgi:hypothetical protein